MRVLDGEILRHCLLQMTGEHQHHQPLQPAVVDHQSMSYWSPMNAVYTTGTPASTTSNNHAVAALHHHANVDQQKTYHALQQVKRVYAIPVNVLPREVTRMQRIFIAQNML